MSAPIFLKTENQLNKVLRNQKKRGDELGVLFVSTWDEHCNNLVEELKDSYSSKKPLYVVNSFSMPHAFVIFNTTKVPHLIKLKKDKVQSEDYLPRVYKALGV